MIGQVMQFAPTVGEPVFGSAGPLLQSITYGVALVVTALLGCVLRNEWRFVIVLIGSLCMFASCLTLFSLNKGLLIVGMVLMGLAFACTSAALWGTINVYRTPTNLGVLYAIPYAGYNFWNFSVSILSGWLLDHFAVWVAVMFWSVCTALAVLLCVVWMRVK